MTAASVPIAWPAPLSDAERAAVGEAYFQNCYKYALLATVGLVATAVVLAFADEHPGGPAATVTIAGLVGLAAFAGRHRYQWLRRHRYALALAGPLTVLASLSPVVDANALYFPALAPLAVIATTAQRHYERVAVTSSLALGTMIAALLDTGAPQLQAPGELASATIAVVVVGALIGVIVDWCARKVMLASDRPGVGQPPPDADEPGRRARVALAEERARREERIEAIARTDTAAFRDLGPPSLAKLTGRELQVLYLVREGLSNADIAAWLTLAERTVTTHVDRVRKKLGLAWSGTPRHLLGSDLAPFPLETSPGASGVETADAGDVPGDDHGA